MSPAQTVRNGAKSAVSNTWVIVSAFMFQGGVFASLIAGALWLGDLNRLVMRNSLDIATHVTDKPHPNAEARLRVLEHGFAVTQARIETMANKIHKELIALRKDMRMSRFKHNSR